MGIGERRPIEIQRAIKTETDSGGGTDEWVKLVNTWAKVVPVRNYFAFQDSQTNLQGVLSFKEIRVDPAYAPEKNMKIIYNGKEYMITGIELNEQKLPNYYNITAEMAK